MIKGVEKGLAAVFVTAVALSFVVSPSSANFFSSPSLGIFNNLFFQTMNYNYAFRIPRADNKLAPTGWYFSDHSTDSFPFLAKQDLTPWDTTQMYVTKSGLYLANADYRSFIFTPTYKIPDSRFGSDKKQVRITLVYTMQSDVIFTGAELQLAYGAGTTTNMNSIMDIDGRYPDQATCNDNAVPSWQQCNINVTVTGNRTTVFVNFYPNTDNLTYMGMSYYPSGGGVSDVTINQLRLQVRNLPGQIIRQNRHYMNDYENSKDDQ